MFTKMTQQHAKTISTWTYSGQYACYNMSQDAMDELMDGSYFAALDAHGALFGYVCFNKSAQIPTVQIGTYDEPALDIGLGLAPSLCGQGRGLGFLEDCLAFAQAAYSPAAYRLSVARFNKRAIKVYERIGFSAVRTVTHAHSKNDFVVMCLPAADVPFAD